MISTFETTAFKPYIIVNEGMSSLELKPSVGQKSIIVILRFIPVLLLVIGLILYLVQNDSIYPMVFLGIALFEAFIFSFIKIPGAVSMDAIGFNLEILSIRGKKEVYYVWNDIDFIRHRMVMGKNSTSLTYDAILKSGKKVPFLTFQNYHAKKKDMERINTVLQQISKKDVRKK